ncbi:MAG: class I SAM-dependent methyltransferase [Pseudomonadota bacterium]
MPTREDEYRNSARGYDFLTARFLDPLRGRTRLLAEREKPLRVLDVCCGTGRQLAQLKGLGALLVGLDLSPAMLKRAGALVGPDAVLCRADATLIPFRDRSFDLAVISFALHEKAPGVRAVILRETLRVLADRGTLAAADFVVPRTPWERVKFLAVRLVERAAGGEHFVNFQEFMGRGGTEAMLARAGLEFEVLSRGVGGGAAVFQAFPWPAGLDKA